MVSTHFEPAPSEPAPSEPGPPRPVLAPARQVTVFRAASFRVVHGVNEGDPLSDASDLVHEDVYALAEDASATRLGLLTDPATGGFRIGPESAAGRPGAQVFLDCRLTFMGPSGSTRDVLVSPSTRGIRTCGEPAKS